MTKSMKWVLGTVAFGLLAGLIWFLRLLFHHSFVEAFLASYLFVAVLLILVVCVDFLLLLQQSLMARVFESSWRSTTLWTKTHSGAIVIISVIVSALNWPAAIILMVKRFGDNRSLKAQLRLFSGFSAHQYYYAVLDCLGAFVIVFIATRHHTSGALKAVALVVAISIMLRHLLLLASPGGTLAFIRRSRSSPFISYVLLTVFDLISLIYITAVAGLWYSGIPINSVTLRSTATTFLASPKTIIAGLSPGAPPSAVHFFGAPFHQQLILVAGLLFYASIIRVISGGPAVFKRNDDDLIALANQHIAEGEYAQALTSLSGIANNTVGSELARAQALLALGKIPEARASIKRKMSMDPSFIYDPTPTDVFYGLFEIVVFFPDVAPDLWDAALKAKPSQGMLFHLLGAEIIFLMSKMKEQPSVSREALSQLPLLNAGACLLIDNEPQACLDALIPIVPTDDGEQCVITTLQCCATLATLSEEAAHAYLEQWMKTDAEPFSTRATPLTEGRTWERALSLTLTSLMEPGFRKVDAGAADWVGQLRKTAMASVNSVLPQSAAVGVFFEDRLRNAATPPQPPVPELPEPPAQIPS